MASTTNADGTTGGIDLAGRLTEMADRTNLMVIDATLRAAAKADALPATGVATGSIGPNAGFADAAAEVRALARRMLQATQDFGATICEPAE